MKSLIILTVLLLSAGISFGQFTYKIKADSVLITNDSCTAELNLENSTKNVVGGFLYNRWKGRTEFRKIILKVDDSTYTLNGDTVTISSGSLSSLPISSLTAATQTNTINNLGYQQEWRWNSLSNSPALKLSTTSTAANANNQTLLDVNMSGVNSNSNQGTYAGRFSNTHTGTGSSNCAVYATASGGDNNSAIFAETSGGGNSSYAGQFFSDAANAIIMVRQATNTNHGGITIGHGTIGSWSFGSKATTGEFAFNNSLFFSGLDIMSLSRTTGNVGIQMGGATGKIHIAAGSASANTAPLKFTSGTNMTTPENGAVEYNGTNYFVTSGSTRYTLAKTLTATATLNFGSTSAGNYEDLTITVTGAADGDAVSLGIPNSAVNAANINYTAWVSSSNTVSVRFNNNSSGAIDPASATFRISVLKY